MTLAEFEAMAQQRLTKAERIVLAKRWLAESPAEQLPDGDHPGVNGGAGRGAHSGLDAQSGRSTDESPIEEDPLWELGRHPVDIGVTDASVAHDRYLYGRADG